MSAGKVLRALIVIALAAATVTAYRVSPDGALEVAATWAREHPVYGGALYVVFVSLATVAFLPGSVSMMLGGFLFGVLQGGVLAMAGIVIGAQLAFYASRLLVRSWVEERVHTDARLHSIEMAISQQAFTIVLLTRLAMVIPFNFLNYVYGATSVRPVTYLRATVAGMLPVVILFVYMGSVARDIGQVLSGEATPSTLAWWLAGCGFVIVAIVTFLVNRAAGRALRNRLQET